MDEENLTQNTTSTPVQESKGLSIASLVCGILSFILCCFGIFSVLLAIASIICGILGMKKGGKGMAIAGIVLSSLGLVSAIIMMILGGAFTTGFLDGLNEALQSYNY